MFIGRIKSYSFKYFSTNWQYWDWSVVIDYFFITFSVKRAYIGFLTDIWKCILTNTISKNDSEWFYNSWVTYFYQPHRYIIMSMGFRGFKWSYYLNNITIFKLKWRKLVICYINLISCYLTVVILWGTVENKKNIKVVCFCFKIWNKFIVY